ncbi:hypothetical protein ABW21_db0203946 [Orbilia brochopaga]|nr:hypothetical protein ABW21_db0203946 [Drechslerella brochopaga]
MATLSSDPEARIHAHSNKPRQASESVPQKHVNLDFPILEIPIARQLIHKQSASHTLGSECGQLGSGHSMQRDNATGMCIIYIQKVESIQCCAQTSAVKDAY